ncbi:hypothetical protein J2X02_003231 [Pseudoxanthomonas japonensis]|uniref:hypothetical protein n=1 Tax=Pseudoxanthomonas TaxID=83618 RepID=UPI000785608A|nr:MULTISPECIES: hypothetical protein [Pseudoxanthomonas]MDR7070366.1 hypothetical protein [Pseudoxanthomonas japonensis]
MRSVLRHLSRYLRLPAMVVLLFAVVSNPVLAAVGDAVEAIQTSSAHAYLGHCDQADQDGIQEDGQAGDLLHALVHGAHTCGHLVGLATPIVVIEPLFVNLAAPDHAVKPLGSFQPLAITRPPITI